jgi:hypothetical protein
MGQPDLLQPCEASTQHHSEADEPPIIITHVWVDIDAIYLGHECLYKKGYYVCS